MLLPDFKDFIEKLPRTGRLLGIDWGARRTGLAISDESWEFVFPREAIVGAGLARPSIETDGRDWQTQLLQEIISIIKSEKIVGVVIGLPVRGNGTDSNVTRMVREFADAFAAETDIPITFINEQLTSVEAEEIIKSKNRKSEIRNRKSEIDSAAAAVILGNAIAMIKRTIA